jgi:hypothetical protein
LPHDGKSFATYSRRKVHVDAAVLVERLSGPKRKAEKRELNTWIITCTIDISTVYYLRLLRMQLKPTLPKPISKPPQHQSGLHFAPAMDDPVVRVATESNAPHFTAHPCIQGVVQK